MFFKDAKAVILVYDITIKYSFEELQTYWAEQIKKSSPPNIILAVAANKSELIEEEVVEEEQGKQFANDIGPFLHLLLMK